MSTITKERIKLFIKKPLDNGLTRGEQMEVARIALASLEADPIGEVSEKRYGLIMDGTVDLGGKSTYRIIKGEKAMKLFPLGTKFYTAPPAPVSVPAAMEIDDDFDSAFEHGKAVGWNAYRAAMLQGAEPVTTDYKLPFDQWLSQQTGTIDVECGCVMTEVFFHWLRVAYEAGKSPVIPDGWVACSERMPEKDDFVYIWPRPDFGVELHVAQYGKFDKRDAGWYAQVYEQNFGIEYHPITVTHWMPLPAAPKQEVKSALEHGMQRYAGAMQKLSEGDK
ncbi:DUF551 domain-containing protein [Citrobacter freundii]|uniref:DUF551 domain-containing protein n=1 Tax=Citrobacter freundii TaxID=546 RepID=UPI0015763220|nr:DUF551 domain-containing protein [Citrobacter freundii]EMB4340270.1 DUF551 domain-containing protein [Citrobacter freundii]MBJ9043159.1 DUF551 domain-containing protein [Citrobacter freundii]NTY74997.1 DUF551 domain-containing protein [Citrobacter freundii]NUA11444.1 DUF551 domain-containing protein [Citrobacter freundii]HAT7546457.1 DUF551 domain-containing protein [Citrobacter freundii]